MITEYQYFSVALSSPALAGFVLSGTFMPVAPGLEV